LKSYIQTKLNKNTYKHIIVAGWGNYNTESVKKATNIIYNYVVNSQNRKFTISNDGIIRRSFVEDDHIPRATSETLVRVTTPVGSEFVLPLKEIYRIFTVVNEMYAYPSKNSSVRSAIHACCRTNNINQNVYKGFRFDVTL
jgi:hypothetical protein